MELVGWTDTTWVRELGSKISTHLQAAEENSDKFRLSRRWWQESRHEMNLKLSRDERNLMIPLNMNGLAVFN